MGQFRLLNMSKCFDVRLLEMLQYFPWVDVLNLRVLFLHQTKKAEISYEVIVHAGY